MIRRLHTIIVGGSLAIGICLAANINAAITDKPEIHFSANLKASYVDNLFLNSTFERDDMYAVFSPGVVLTAEDNGGAGSYSIGYIHRFTFYDEYDGLNDNFPELDARVSFDSGVTLVNAHAGYREWASNTIEVNAGEDLIDWSLLMLGGDVRYELSDLTAFKVGVGFDNLDYDMDEYTDHETVSVPVAFLYRIRPHVELSGGARYRSVNNGVSQRATFDYKDLFYYGGVTGELFSPKLYADLKAGIQTRDYKGAKRDESSPSYDISLVYNPEVKTSAYLTLSRDFRSSANGGLSYSSTNVTLGGRFSLSDFIDLEGAIAVGKNSYELISREEDVQILTVGTHYHPNDRFSVSANYSYSDVDGNGKAFARDYRKNEISVTASVRY